MWKRPRTLHLRHLTDNVRAASDHAAIDADIMLSSELRHSNRTRLGIAGPCRPRSADARPGIVASPTTQPISIFIHDLDTRTADIFIPDGVHCYPVAGRGVDRRCHGHSISHKKIGS